MLNKEDFEEWAPPRKESSITLRCTDAEKKLLQKTADNLGISFSAYVLGTAVIEAKKQQKT